MTDNKNIILNTDSYKHSMFLQYPPKTEYTYSYVEPRRELKEYSKILYSGLQPYLMEYLSVPITKENIEEAEDVLHNHKVPFNKEGWQHILNKHGGYLPLSISSILEGLCVNKRTVLATVVNTDPACYWLTTHIETSLLRAIWYPTTVGTISRRIKDTILQYLERSGTPETIDYKLHNFGARGVSSLDSAGIGDTAHQISFKGTDTISGILHAKKYYFNKQSAVSVPASEHSTMTSWGRRNEVEAYRNMLHKFNVSDGIISIVSDSYSIYNAVEKIYGEILKQEILDNNATLVIRCDSGCPIDIPLIVAEMVDAKFGSTVNSKGYKVLNKVRILQGDGINHESIVSILDNFEKHGYSSDNITFGMGGALMQSPTRDDLGFAMKCSAVNINGKWENIMKDPATDPFKRSYTGLVKTYMQGNKYIVKNSILCPDEPSLMREVFRDGKILHYTTFEELINNSNIR
jgi:nicotinamide phosphoribosyltransferase